MTREERFAAFGQWCFEEFWHDAEPGDLDAGDLQEKAVEFGLLRHRQDGDGACWCEESGEGPFNDCQCLWPTMSSKKLEAR